MSGKAQGRVFQPDNDKSVLPDRGRVVGHPELTKNGAARRVMSGLTVIVPLSELSFRVVILTRSGRICGCFSNLSTGKMPTSELAVTGQ
jgi:hypothetical protein